jgi:hypothetical protein
MLKLHIVQAEQGDCLVLEYLSSGKTSFLLIDGGPGGIYDNHLRGFLTHQVMPRGTVERVLLSHVDDDHVNGLLDLFGDLQVGALPLKLGGLWHNTFSQVVGRDVEQRLFGLTDRAFTPREADFLLNKDRSIAQGDSLTGLAGAADIPINPGIPGDGLFSVETVTEPLTLGDLKLTVVGPRQKNLEQLRKEWMKWLAKREKDLEKGIVPRALDQSVPNLSSIMFLVEYQGMKILLTGDGRGDHLLQGLRTAGLLKPGKSFHVDVLKLPHHGSVRNADLKFFETITADRYVISANGRDGNPDLDTLVWIAQAAKAQGRKFEVLITNDTDSTRQFRTTFKPEVYGYTWTVLPKGAHALSLDLSAGGTITIDDMDYTQPVSAETVTVVEAEARGGTPTSRRALLVGINEFPNPAWKLRGCVNDSLDLLDILKTYYGFQTDEIHLLHDKKATSKTIRDQLTWLLSDYAGNDVRLFAFSSHGTQVDDKSGDEVESFDEVIVPYDHSWENPFLDDLLYEIFKDIPESVNFTFLADTCHSGTIQRDLLESGIDFVSRYIPPPPEIRDLILIKQEEAQDAEETYIAQEMVEMLKLIPMDQWAQKINEIRELLRNRFRHNRYQMVATNKHILLASCRSDQTSADAFIEGTYRGAFTWALGKAIRESNGNVSYEKAMRSASEKMKKFTQIPQLECPDNQRGLRLFSAVS